MQRLLAMVLCAVLLSQGVLAMGRSPDHQERFLTADEARSSARSGYAERSWAFPSEYGRAMAGAKAGHPLLVQRLERKDSFYYIVPFERQGKATLVVMIDARSGAFKEAACFPQPTVYPPLNQSMARRKLAEALRLSGSRAEAASFSATLVWMPSEASRSPFEPYWRFTSGNEEWYLDQKGELHRTIELPAMKGG